MPALEVTINATLDGRVLDGFPIVKRLSTVTLETRVFTKASGAGYVALTDDVASIAAAIMQTDQPISVKLNGSATSFTLNAGGLMVLLDVLLDAGAATNVTLENTSGATATVRGGVLGT